MLPDDKWIEYGSLVYNMDYQTDIMERDTILKMAQS